MFNNVQTTHYNEHLSAFVHNTRHGNETLYYTVFYIVLYMYNQ